MPVPRKFRNLQLRKFEGPRFGIVNAAGARVEAERLLCRCQLPRMEPMLTLRLAAGTVVLPVHIGGPASLPVWRLDSMAPHDDQVPGREAIFPRVDVRVVLFTVRDGLLWVALQTDHGSPRLPSGAPRPDEALDSAATHVLAVEMGLEERYLEQLYSIAQNPSGEWTVTVAYLGLALAGDDGPSVTGADWFSAAYLPEMDALDRRIVEYALLRLRAKLGYTTIAFHLLPRSFSLSELQLIYEAVLDRPLDKRNFRRRIHAGGFLAATGETRREGSHRPARLFQFRAVHDAETYLVPAWVSNQDGETSAT